MLKRFLCYAVLFAMVLHCSSRIGVVSWLYGKRHSIAFSIGIISEIPIAVCSVKYEGSNQLTIDQEDASSKVPALIQAQEINLFMVSAVVLKEVSFFVLPLNKTAAPSLFYHHQYSSSVFHPPSC